MKRELYLQEKERINNDPHLNNNQKRILCFNLWIDYVYHNVENSKNEQLKYSSECVRVHV